MTQDSQLVQPIDHLHFEYSRMDKVMRLAYLRWQWNRLNLMACQYAAYLRSREVFTRAERENAQRLVNMIESLAAGGVKVETELRDDTLKELMKAIMG